MKRLAIPLFAALLALGAPSAFGAAMNATIVVGSPVSTAITPTPVAPWTMSGTAPNFTFNYPGTSPVPAPAGSVVATLAAAPSAWVGTITLSGTNASSFTINGAVAGLCSATGCSLVVGATALPAGSYGVVTATSAP